MATFLRHQLSRSTSTAVPEFDSFNPSRLTVARKRQGMTIVELASELDLDRRSLTAFEAGEYSPSEETLRTIATKLDFPIAFFFGPTIEEPSADSASFRALTKMKAAHRDMALAQGALAIHLNDWLEKKFELPKPDLPDLSTETSPEAAAVSLRRYWRIGELSVRNMIHLLEAKGCRIFSLAILAREVDAFSLWMHGTPFIFLNTQKNGERSRFDAAHELGHLVLHKSGAPQGRGAELEANAFASAFLMPRGDVIANAPRFPTFQDLVKAKKRWKTSVAALNHRLHIVGMLSDWQYRTLCIQIAKLGRDTEPNQIERETSQVLPAVFSSLYQDGFTRSDVARELTVKVADLEQMMFGLTLTGIEGRGRSAGSRADTQHRLRLVERKE